MKATVPLWPQQTNLYPAVIESAVVWVSVESVWGEERQNCFRKTEGKKNQWSIIHRSRIKRSKSFSNIAGKLCTEHPERGCDSRCFLCVSESVRACKHALFVYFLPFFTLLPFFLAFPHDFKKCLKYLFFFIYANFILKVCKHLTHVCFFDLYKSYNLKTTIVQNVWILTKLFRKSRKWNSNEAGMLFSSHLIWDLMLLYLCNFNTAHF